MGLRIVVVAGRPRPRRRARPAGVPRRGARRSSSPSRCTSSSVPSRTPRRPAGGPSEAAVKHPWRWIIGLLVLAFLIALAILPARQEAWSSRWRASSTAKSSSSCRPSAPSTCRSPRRSIYLWISVAVLILVFAILVARSLKVHPGRFQYAMETLYEPRPRRHRRLGDEERQGHVVPLHRRGLRLRPHRQPHRPGARCRSARTISSAFYAATANLNVTLMLALFTFVFTHYAGIRKNGGTALRQAWAPPSAPPVLKQLIWVHPRGERDLPAGLALRASLRQHGRRTRDPRRVLRHGAHLPELPRAASPCRARRCSSTCSSSSWPSSRPSSSPSSPPCTSAERLDQDHCDAGAARRQPCQRTIMDDLQPPKNSPSCWAPASPMGLGALGPGIGLGI